MFKTMDSIFWTIMAVALLAIVIGEIQHRIDTFNDRHKD